MNLPTRILICTLFIAACSLLIIGASIAVPTLAELPRPIPLNVTPDMIANLRQQLPTAQVVTVYDLHGHPLGTTTITPTPAIIASGPNGQLLPTAIKSTTELLPTHWNPVKNLLISH